MRSRRNAGARRPVPAVVAPALLAALVAVLAGALGVGVRATYGAQAAVDEPQYLLTAVSLAEDGDLDIADELAARRWRAYSDVPLPVQTQRLADGTQISPHDPLLPVLLAPPTGLGGWVAAKFTLCVLAGLTAALTVWVAVRRFAVPPRLAGIGTAVAFASPPLAVYAHQVYPELPAACAALAAVAAVTGPLRRGGLTVLVAAVVALPWLGAKFVPVAGVLALLGIARLVHAGRRRAAAVLTGTLALATAGYLLVHRAVWGGWTSYATGDHFQATGEFSVVGVSPDYVGRSLRLVALLVDRGYGLVPWQPGWLLLVPAVGALAVARPRGWVALAGPLVAGWATATWLALTMHGFWWPGRQLVVVLPLALLGVLWWLCSAARWLRVVAAAAGLLGVLALAASLLAGYAGRAAWVHPEDVGDPVHALLGPLFPDYRGSGPAFWALHLGWAAGLLALLAAGARSAATAVPQPVASRAVRLPPGP